MFGWRFCRQVPRFQLLPDDRLPSLTIRPKPEFPDKDHVHILFSAKPQVQLSKLVNSYKTATSRLLRKEFAEFLEPYYWKPYFWSRSYFISTDSERSYDAVTAYIENQETN